MTSRSRGFLALTGMMERSRPSIECLNFSFTMPMTRHDGPDVQSLGGHGMRPLVAAHAVAASSSRLDAGVFRSRIDSTRQARPYPSTRLTHHVPYHGWYHTEALRTWSPPRSCFTVFRPTISRHMAINSMRSKNPAHHRNTHRNTTTTTTTNNPVVNIPNALSMARLVSGPAIGHLILTDNLSLAIPCLIVSAFTDWLDGYAARKTKTVNVLGSYLDPLADKVLVGSVAISMGYTGLLDPWLFGLIIGRDACIVVGSFGLRWRRFGYSWPDGGWKEFFNVVQEAEENGTAQGVIGDPSKERLETRDTTKVTTDVTTNATTKVTMETATRGGSSLYTTTRPAEPLYISKVNTVAQLTLISATLTGAWINFPSQDIITAVLAPVTAVTTVTSGLAYVDAYRQGKLRI